jgi:hypothetical protein
MVLFWATVPLMVLAIGWAVGVVLVRSIHEDRRLRAEAMITGHEEVPADDMTRVVVEAKPAFETRAKFVVREGLHKSGGPEVSGRTQVTPTANDRHIVLTVPEVHAQSATIERIVDHLNEDESVETVKVIPARASSDLPEA